jgi:ammonium transporter, Amt family
MKAEKQSKICFRFVLLVLAAILVFSSNALASEEQTGPDIGSIIRGIDTLWVLLGAFLVFFMQAGFGMIEAGFIRAKNTCNILTKNFLDFCMASIGFFMMGYAIMFGDGNTFMGFKGWFLINAESGADVPMFAFWLFQATFCGAAATIVAGGMAERMKFVAYIIYSFIISALIYPIVGHWIWGGGWLAGMGFADFAGSAVVHTVGGVAALVGTYILKPRSGKYSLDGKPHAIPAHSIPLASLGLFILWFGWFGFNSCSSLSVGNGELIARVAINTNIAAAAGGIAAITTVWKRFGKPDLSMGMNGSLAGLVAITAPCAFVEPWAAIVIGAAGGVLVVIGVELLDKLQIDDPVGAFPVHGIGGIFGTLAVGIFGKPELGIEGFIYTGNPLQLGTQLVGIVSVILFIAFSMGLVFKVIDKTIGLRASETEELRGLDICEHGMESYGGFQIFS